MPVCHAAMCNDRDVVGDPSAIFEAVDELLGVIAVPSPVEVVMSAAIDECSRRRPDGPWREVRQLQFVDDVSRSMTWWTALLDSEPPPTEVNGLWFGIFNPTDDASDFYVSGSSAWPERDWPCETSWWPAGRYAKSPVMAGLRRLTMATGDEQIAFFGEYFLTLAFAGATITAIVDATPPSAVLGLADHRAIAFGHDSGDFFDVGRIDSSGATWAADGTGSNTGPPPGWSAGPSS